MMVWGGGEVEGGGSNNNYSADNTWAPVNSIMEDIAMYIYIYINRKCYIPDEARVLYNHYSITSRNWDLKY